MFIAIILLFLIPIRISSSKTFLFISIPYIGHLNPLIQQAMELYHRHNLDANIYIISCSNIRSYVERNCLNTTIQFLDIGSCQNETKLTEDLQYLASQTNSLSGISILFQAIIELYYPQMYEQILNTIDAEIFQKDQTTIAIIDRVTYAGADIADYFHIPYVINVAGLLPYISWHVIPPFDSNPAILLDPPQSIHSIGTNLFFRIISPTIRYISLIYMYFRYDRAFNSLRQTKFHLNNTVHLWSRYHSHLFLVNNAFGLEYSQELPANVQLTGPMLSIKHSSDYYLNELSEEDRQWIDSDSRPIIYINFGTCVSLTTVQVQKIFLALESSNQYRIVWKLTHYNDLILTSNFRIVQWISSPLGYLAHSNVHLFISHCGINSVYESIWLGTSILCLPIFADQQDMAQRVEDAGVGKWLHKLTFTSEQLKQTIEAMFKEKERLSRERNIKRVQAWMKLHWGVERAVDLIETVAEYGIELLVPINHSYSWYAFYNLDVYAIWLLLVIGLQQCIARCCCCCCSSPGRRSLFKNQSKTKTS